MSIFNSLLRCNKYRHICEHGRTHNHAWSWYYYFTVGLDSFWSVKLLLLKNYKKIIRLNLRSNMQQSPIKTLAHLLNWPRNAKRWNIYNAILYSVREPTYCPLCIALFSIVFFNLSNRDQLTHRFLTVNLLQWSFIKFQPTKNSEKLHLAPCALHMYGVHIPHV